MREQYIKIHNLSVAKELADFVKNELLLDTNVGPDEFWKGFDKFLSSSWQACYAAGALYFTSSNIHVLEAKID